MERAILELWWKVQVSHTPLRLCFSICLLSGCQPHETRVRWCWDMQWNPGFRSNLWKYTNVANQCYRSSWTWTWSPLIRINSLQNKLFYFNLLISWPHPTPPHHTHNKTTHPKSEIPATVCHIVIIFIIFLCYKTIFPTDPHCVSSWRSYSLKQYFP